MKKIKKLNKHIFENKHVSKIFENKHAPKITEALNKCCFENKHVILEIALKT